MSGLMNVIMSAIHQLCTYNQTINKETQREREQFENKEKFFIENLKKTEYRVKTQIFHDYFGQYFALFV